MKFVLAGGTGELGRRIAATLLADRHEVVVLTRSPGRIDPGLAEADGYRQVAWDGRTVGEWAGELDGAVVINLAGELVDRRPTAANISQLRDSRTKPTRALVEASQRCPNPPPLWLQMSTLAIYGDAGPDVIDESHPPADGPPQMAGVAVPWEASAEGAACGRLVYMRTGLVLEAGTPALDRLMLLTKLGLGGRISSGDQWVSWIHVDDFVRALGFLIDNESMTGVVHITSPEPVQNKDMMASLRAVVGRPASPPTPAPLVRLGALIMRTDPALALTGRRCVPRRLLDAGFTFEHPEFREAIADLVKK